MYSTNKQPVIPDQCTTGKNLGISNQFLLVPSEKPTTQLVYYLFYSLGHETWFECNLPYKPLDFNLH